MIRNVHDNKNRKQIIQNMRWYFQGRKKTEVKKDLKKNKIK